jgi:hypothetical protein
VLVAEAIHVDDAAGDEALATQRLEAVQQLVASVTPPSSSLTTDVSTGPSSSVTPVLGTDGAIGLGATKPAQQTTDMEVYYAENPSVQAVEADINAGNGDGALGRAGALTDCGPVSFVVGASQSAAEPTQVIDGYHDLPAADQVANTWVRGWVFYTAQEQASPSLLKRRGEEIGVALRQTNATIETVEVTQALPNGGTAIVVYTRGPQ